MISIYLLTKNNQFIFSTSFVFNFQKSYLHLVSKEFIIKFQFGYKNYFHLFFYKKRMNFYNFIYKSISICFHLKRVTYTNY